MKKIQEFNEIYSAVTAIYTMGKPIVSFLRNKYKEKQIDTAIEKVMNDDVEEILRENLHTVLSIKEKELELENYDKILDYQFKEKLIKEVLEKNSELRIYEKDIEEYIHGFINTVLDYLEDKANDKLLLRTVIKLNHNTEINADIRKEEIKRAIYTALNEKNVSLQVIELPFEVEDMNYIAELNNGRICHKVEFNISKSNYKVVIEDVFVAVESPTGVWAFYNQSYFLLNSYFANQNIEFSSNACGMKKIDSSGIVIYFKVYNRQNYYIRVFGDMGMLYYEPLTEQEYNAGRNRYRMEYKNAMKVDSNYEEWRRFYASVMYADFGQ